MFIVKRIGFNSDGEYLSPFGLYWYSFASGDTYGLRFRRFNNGKTLVIVDEFTDAANMDVVIEAMNEHHKQLVLNLLA